MADRLRFGIQGGIRPALQFVDDTANAVWIILNPRAQPAADVSPARDRGEIVKLLEQPAARQALQNSQSKGGAPDAAARDAERRAFFL